MAKLYLAVVVLETLVIAALWVLGQHFLGP